MAPFSLFARAYIAYSVHEHIEGHTKRIDLWLQPRSFTVQDDGRGMGLHRSGYVESLMATLIESSSPVQLHGVGLSIVAVSSPRVAVESRRGGLLWTQSFAWGIAEAPPRSVPGDETTGTKITVELPPGSPDLDAADVLAQVDHWRRMHPALTFIVH